jgi:pyruvate/2-oxoglutarate dehydrogenase complex dihydrolipoamide dehydrogenase (E3) component
MKRTYDAVIIGTGQGGMPLSQALAKAGWKTAIIEEKYVGGCCINYGCTPTKTMWNSARVAYLTRRAADYGVRVGDVNVDMRAVRERKASVVERFRTSDERRLSQTENEELLFGDARFTAPHALEVRLRDGGTDELEAEHIFINTGGLPLIPPIEGLDEVDWLDSTSILELDAAPDQLLVLGGSYIGLEFGQMFRRFGSRVTIVEMGQRLIRQEDPDVSEEMAKIMREDGIDVLLETTATRFARGAGGQIEMTIEDAGGQHTLSGSHVLIAIGRVPNTKELNLETAGVATDGHGVVKVNDRLETNVPGVYAIGDVKGGPQFTHISYDDYRVLRDNLLDGASHTTNGRPVPYTMFTDPQLGRIGLNETQAREKGLDVKVAKMPMNYVARAIEMGETRGFMKAVVDAKSEEILGFSVLGVEGGELMAMVEIAMLGKVRYPVLREAIFAHPTLAESFINLFGYVE